MPSRGDIKTITGVMYPLQIADAMEVIDGYQNFKVSEWVSWGGTFLSIISKSLSLASTAVSLAFGITANYSADHLETQENLYGDLLRDVVRHNLVYVEIRQKYEYIVVEGGEGWILKGNPTAVRHYRDYYIDK